MKFTKLALTLLCCTALFCGCTKDSDVVKLLSSGIKAVKNIESKIIGIGGGTVGSYLRNEGYQCAVWSTLDETAHQPDEYCVVKNMVEDAKVLAYIML